MILICPLCGKTQSISKITWDRYQLFGGHPFTCDCGDHIVLIPAANRMSDPLMHPEQFIASGHKRYLAHVINPLARSRAWMHKRWKGGYYTNWNYKANRNWRRE